MNAKQNLADKLMLLVNEDSKPDFARVWETLSGYQIGYIAVEGGADFKRQVDHFIFAKRSEGVANGTAKNYRIYLNILNNYLDKAPAEIDVTDLRDFVAYLGDVRKLKMVSVQSVINILRSFFGWLHQEEIIPRNPMIRIKSFKIDRKESRHPLTAEQLEMIRNCCQTYREKALVEFLYSSGCRVAELEQIELDTVDMYQRSVSVIGKG
ncbi:MAG: phage integrase N-terminal SAM-like domain-containing protein, partial [Angelakisella sp.]